jgi:pimeloyl-ACP methyl ester carboxylesterase
MPTTHNRIALRDGRSLAFCEYGDVKGSPVLYLHGVPGSRLDAKLADQTGRRLNARIIGIDRPGFGLSDFKRGRKIGHWPLDVADLADALGIDRFAVVGVSGGGPYGLACALRIPQRLSSVGIVCGLGPLDIPGAIDRMTVISRVGLHLARRASWILELVCVLIAVLMRHNPEGIVAHMAARAGHPDKAVLGQPELRQILSASFRESVRTGPSGVVRDLVLFSRPWGFRLQDISMEVHLWHGERDLIVPPSLGRDQARAIPSCQCTFYPNEGHFSLIVNHMEEILGSLIG